MIKQNEIRTFLEMKIKATDLQLNGMINSLMTEKEKRTIAKDELKARGGLNGS